LRQALLQILIGSGERENIEPYGLRWGTPEQVADRLRAYGEAGLRHVVIELASALSSRWAAFYGLLAMRKIARLLKTGRRPGAARTPRRFPV